MKRTPREIVRSAVGLAVVLPAIALGILAVVLFLSGGLGGVLSGLLVAAVAVGLLVVALLMTHAPVTIHKLLEGTEAKRAGQREAEAGDHAGSNGHANEPPAGPSYEQSRDEEA